MDEHSEFMFVKRTNINVYACASAPMNPISSEMVVYVTSCMKTGLTCQTCQPVGLKILENNENFLTLRSHSSKPLSSTATILSYLGSAQQALKVSHRRTTENQ